VSPEAMPGVLTEGEPGQSVEQPRNNRETERDVSSVRSGRGMCSHDEGIDLGRRALKDSADRQLWERAVVCAGMPPTRSPCPERAQATSNSAVNTSAPESVWEDELTIRADPMQTQEPRRQ
jgi:hypothetical protein